MPLLGAQMALPTMPSCDFVACHLAAPRKRLRHSFLVMSPITTLKLIIVGIRNYQFRMLIFVHISSSTGFLLDYNFVINLGKVVGMDRWNRIHNDVHRGRTS